MTTYAPPTSRRERILAFGTFGSGKSEAVTKIREKAVAEDRMLYVSDTERAYEALLDPDDALVDVTDLSLAEWPDYIADAERMLEIGQEGDWWAYDSASQPWEVLQNWALDQGWENDRGDGIDWQRVNREYATLQNAWLAFPGHVLLTARWKELTPPKRNGEQVESRQTLQTYGRFGGRPAGQKDLGHVVPHTVLLMGQTRSGTYVMSTVKDRKRKVLVDEPVRDFARDYLVKIAGWTVEADELDIDLDDADDAETEE